MKFVILAMTATLCVSCRRAGEDSVWWDKRAEIIELEQKLELARYRAEGLGLEEPPSLPAADPHEAERLRGEIGSLAKDKQRLSGEIAALRDGWEGFRAEVLYQRRAEAIKGFSGDFTMADGRVLEDVRITRIEDGGVSLIHSTGAARLRFGDMDASQQAYFGMDGELAAIAQGKEQRQRIAYEKWVDAGLAANEAKAEKLAKETREEERRLASARAMAAATTVPRTSALSDSIGALGETSATSGRYLYRRSTSYHDRPSVRYRYYYVRPAPCTNGIPFWGGSTPFRPATQCPPVPNYPPPANPFLR